METATQLMVANFLRTDQKKIDWRFETSDSMTNKGVTDPKTIYWLGILDLKSVDKSQKEYPLSFITHHGDLKEDREWRREPDGARGDGVVTIFYDFSGILSELLTVKEGGEKYLHLLVTEKVRENGQLSVNILVDKEKFGAEIFPFPWLRSSEPWTELPTFKTAYLSYIDVSKLTRVCIRSTRSYNWQK